MSLHDIAARALHVLDPEDAHGWAIRGLKMGLGPRQSDLMLLTVEADDLGEALKWEASRGGALFPHLFRDLRVDEVVAERALDLDADGVPVLGGLTA